MIITGDALNILPTLDAESVQCVVTSPPYYGLRDYGCDEQIGLEPTPEAYVEKLVAVFREVRRVLRDDGTVWLNLGDSYASASACDRRSVIGQGSPSENCKRPNRLTGGLKEKDLIGIPWRVAFALQADGWWLRQDIIWKKPNPMPESVTDRCTKAHEYIFLLTKSARYYYDAEAVKENATGGGALRDGFRGDMGAYVNQRGPQDNSITSTNEGRSRRDSFKRENSKRSEVFPGQSMGIHRPDREESSWDISTRNRRSVWTIATKPFKEAHFATFPPEIPEICIKAGTSEKGCCPECGSPWERVVEKTTAVPRRYGEWKATGEDHRNDIERKGGFYDATSATTGWRPTCDCEKPILIDWVPNKAQLINNGPHDPVPCIVLDPFSGAGTTGLVAEKLGRKYIGIELKQEYVEMSEKRMFDELGGLFT